MTATIEPITVPVPDEDVDVQPGGFLHDVTSIAGRALRAVPRDWRPSSRPCSSRCSSSS